MMRILVFSGDIWHPAHIVRAGLERLEDFEFDWIEHADEWPAERIFEYPLMVLAKANQSSETDKRPWVTPGIEKILLGFVRRGNGLLVVHGGLARYGDGDLPDLRALMGGTFIQHPKQCPVTVKPKARHPLTVGSAPYTLTDEHYFVELDDAGADVFLTTESEHGTQPGGWTRFEGEGRVCALTPSHNLEGWQHPSFQALLRSALGWCGTKTGLKER